MENLNQGALGESSIFSPNKLSSRQELMKGYDNEEM
jgi:hypothetical protein